MQKGAVTGDIQFHVRTVTRTVFLSSAIIDSAYGAVQLILLHRKQSYTYATTYVINITIHNLLPFSSSCNEKKNKYFTKGQIKQIGEP